MKTTARHQLEICISADELLELCSGEDLKDIPLGLSPTFKQVKFDEGSPMITLVLSFVSRDVAPSPEDPTPEQIEAAAEQLGDVVREAARELLPPRKSARKR